MTLLFMDGFAAGDWSTKWEYMSLWTVDTTLPRLPGGFTATCNYSGILHRIFTASPEIIVGVAVRFTAGAHFGVMWLGDSAALPYIYIHRTEEGYIRVTSSGSTFNATGTTVVDDDTWIYVEVRAIIHPTNGVCQVRLNGSNSNEIDYAGNTTRTGVGAIDIASFGLDSTNGGERFTDVYVLNTAGAVNNTWLGDMHVYTIVPTSDGSSSQWLGSDGDSVNNWALIDELPVTGADYPVPEADYVGSSTIGAVDLYGLGALPDGITDIKGIAWNGFVSKSDAGARAAAAVLLSDSTTDTGPSLTLPTSPATQQVIWEADPATSAAWTPEAVDDLEAGIQVDS